MASSWWEIQILSDLTLEDSIFWRLQCFGCKGTASEVKGNYRSIKAYLPSEQAQLLDLAALSLWLRQDALCLGVTSPIMKWRLIDEEDWASSWRQHWQPAKIGDRLLINPAWLPVPEKSDRLILRLDPGVAFGTGTHPTTQLCLEALEMRLDGNQLGATVADIGCGSGILAIGALLLGASRVYAVDTDPLAVRAARSNRSLNHFSDKQLVVTRGTIGDLIHTIDAPVDGIACNILAEVIVDLIPQLDAIAKPVCWGIISGVLVEQAKPVADVLEQHGWTVATLWRRKDWCCFNIRRE